MTDSLLTVNDTASNPLVLALIVGAVLLGLLICGWSMKLACGFCGGREVGILRGMAASIASSLTATAAMGAIVLVSPDSSAWVAPVYGLFAAVATVAIVLVQNPLRALCTYLVYSVIGAAFAIAGAAATAGLLYYNLDEQQFERLAAHYTASRRAADPPDALLPEPPVAPVLEVRSLQPPAPAPTPTPPKKKLPPGVKANPFVK